MDRHKISASEAQERLDLQEQVSKLAAELRTSEAGDFGDIWSEHEPVYRIVVAFASNKDRSYIRDRLSPQMRRYVQFKVVKTSIEEREKKIDQIISLLGPLKIDYVSYYEHRTDSLVIESNTDRAVQLIRTTLPNDLQSFVTIRKAPIPKKAQATNARAGDGVYPGWWYYKSNTGGNLHNCSFGFHAKNNSGKPLILSASHCDQPTWIYFTDHWVSLAAPLFDHYTYGTKYDYQGQDITGLTSGPWVWYVNGKITYPGYEHHPNSVPGQPGNGYFRVTGTKGYYDQKVGDVVCKSGRSTGFTCGKITHGFFTYRNAKGWIESGESSQYIYGTFGDSGAGVFTAPNTSGDTSAIGILSAVTYYDPTPFDPNNGDDEPCTSATETDPTSGITDCKIIHMPIDYVDDHQLVTVVTATP
jgi:hypothetical protein